MDGDWVFSATTTCAILPEPNLDTVGKVVLRNRSAVRVSGPLIAEFRGISALVPKNVMDGDWGFSATTTCAILPEPNLDTVGNVVLRNRSAVRVSGPLIDEFRGISALVPKNVMDGDWVFSATTTCAILPEPNLDTVGNVVLETGPLFASPVL